MNTALPQKYYVTAILLSLGWFPVLLIPSNTREWLLAGPPVWLHLLLLAAAGLLLSHLLSGFILRADGLGARVIRGIVLPLCGCFFYLCLHIAVSWGRQLLFGGLVNLHDSMSLLVYGMLFTAFSFYVVVPYGVACQYLMEWAAGEE